MNPLDIKNIGDPYILKYQDNYYLYATSFFNGFYVWQSNDLLSWSRPQVCYSADERSFGNSCFWAPEIYEWDGKFFLYYTAQHKSYVEENLQIGVAISDSPLGPFTDVFDSKPISTFGMGVLDAHVLKDHDQDYLYFSSAGANNIVNAYKQAEIFVVKLNADHITTTGEPVKIITTDMPYEKMSESLKQFWCEGPFVIKYGNYYHLMYSVNFYASREYSVCAARSKNPMKTFIKYPNNPIIKSNTIVSGPGHNSVVEAPDGKNLVCVYHAHSDYDNPSDDRQVYLSPLIVENDYILPIVPSIGDVSLQGNCQTPCFK